ncbi:uncharacterized protein [Diabrotica undecimpunctata]|uniref:uncharacterized protein n=1 Tax=Diabrotica undecimpunctata TaxID=50387 RepID=UPI003B631CE6
MKKGEIEGKQKGKVKIIKWMDKRPVLMICTIPEHDAALTDTGKKKNRKNESVMNPSCVIHYYKAKKGVDVSDQMSSYYSVLRRTLYRRQLAEELTSATPSVAPCNEQIIGKSSEREFILL